MAILFVGALALTTSREKRMGPGRAFVCGSRSVKDTGEFVAQRRVATIEYDSLSGAINPNQCTYRVVTYNVIAHTLDTIILRELVQESYGRDAFV